MTKADVAATLRDASQPGVSWANMNGMSAAESQPTSPLPTVARPDPPAPGTVWVLHRGFIDLFVQPLDGDTGRPGRRHHIVRVEAGEAVVGMAPPSGCPFRLCAVPSLDLDAEVGRLDEIASDPNKVAAFGAWCRRIATVLPDGVEAAWPGAASAETLRRVDDLHAALFEAVVQRLAEADHLDRQRLDRRRHMDSGQVAQALRRLGAVLDQAAVPLATAPAATDDACAAAVGQVLSLLGTPPRAFPPMQVVADEAAIDRTERLAAVARLRGRRVLLVRRWWRQDRGLLIAFKVDEAQTPVVLRPRGGGGYDALGRDGRATRVSTRTAEELRVDAFQLYSAFAPGPVALRQVLRVAGRAVLSNGAAVAAMSLLTGVLALAPPLAIAFLFNTVLPQADMGLLLQVAIGIGVIALGGSLFELTKAIALVRLESKMSLTFEAALVDRILNLPVRFFAGFASGDLVDRMLAMSEIRRTVAGQGVLLLLELLFSGFSVVLLFAIHPLLAMGAFGFLVLAFGCAVVLNLAALHHEIEAVVEHGRLEGLTVQLVLGIGKLRVAAAEQRALAAWSRLFARQQEQLRSSQAYRVALQVFAALLPTAGLGLLFLGATAFRSGPATAALPAGSFMAFNAAFGALLGVVMAVSIELTTLLRCVPLYRQAHPLLKSPIEPIPANAQTAPPTGRIEIHDLRFRYLEDGPPALDGLDLTIKRGEYLALVGPSGSGKSTLIRLLLGFEKPQGGAILFDGVPQDHLDPATLRRSMGVVLQQSRISPGNMYTNIVGSSGLGLEAAWEAARQAGLAADIEALPMGMHTTMLEGGQGLSGGQRQRLLIARALVHKPKILLFDEATSALDNRTQSIVMQTVADLQATRVVIAHRLSTIRQADRICVIEAGKLVQSGSYDALSDCQGPFRNLIERQSTRSSISPG